jgi:hypothetical protein
MTVDLATALAMPALCAANGVRPPAIVGPPQAPTRDLVWTPDLSAAELAQVNDLLTMAKFGIAASLTLAEFGAIKPDLATARTYVGLASPTAAQTAAALRSTIRVLGALLRQ